MAQQFLTSINLNSNELQNALLHPLATAPAVGAAGKVYYNTSEDILYISDGSAWRNISGDITSVTAGAGLTGDAITGDVTIDIGSGDGITVNSDNIQLNIDTSQFGFNAGALTILTGAIGPDELENTTVTAGSYGSSTAIPTFTVDADGRLTAAGTASITTVLSVSADAGSGDGVSLADDTLVIAGGSNINTSITGDTVTINLDDDVTIGNNLIVSGNLTVSGTTTTVNTETINLADNIITLNSNATGTASEDAGIEVERGDDTNVSLVWNEATNRWTFTNDGSTYYNIPTTPELTDPITDRQYKTTISDSATVTHNLDSLDVIVQLYDSVTLETVFADVVRTNNNSINITFASTPTNSIRVLVIEIG